MNFKEINVLKANIVGGMDMYIKDVIGIDEVTEYWLTYGMPDGETEDDLMADVDDDELFESWVTVFKNCLDYAKRIEEE